MAALNQQPPTAEHRSVDHWIDRVNRICGPFLARAIDDQFAASIDAPADSALHVSVVAARKAHLYRTRDEISHDDGQHYYAVFQLDGTTLMDQDGQRIRLAPGDITVIDSCQPCDFRFDGLSRQLSLLVPRPVMHAALHQAHVSCAERIDGDSRLGQLANQLVRSSSEQPNLDAMEAEATVSALATLLGPALSRNDRDTPHERAFSKAMATIDAHLCEQELTPSLVAKEADVSLRSLYRIFAQKELVVAQHIKRRRLQLCAERLRNNTNVESLSALCYACGFSDTSYFSTAFKQHFGLSPGQYRDRVRGG